MKNTLCQKIVFPAKEANAVAMKFQFKRNPRLDRMKR
jgi:hypothetical protein